MFKWMRRLIGMVIVLFILLVILLVPGSIPEGEQLRNVQAGSSLIELAQNAVSNASVSTEGLSTELSLNSVQLSQVVKQVLDLLLTILTFKRWHLEWMAMTFTSKFRFP